MPFGLKNVGSMFQRAMSFAFNELKKIVEAYLDDLVAHSHKRVDHLVYIRLILERCRYYCIRLILNRCIFYVILVHLLSFIVSNKDIMVDPLKVEAIVQLPPRITFVNYRVFKERPISFDIS
jgi:hypothetical protein